MRIRIGTRGSDLAMAQTRMVAAAVRSAAPQIELEIITITTSGDRSALRNAPMEQGKGDFVKELEAALLDRRVDAAVHSLKDLPVNLPEGLALAACLAEARDIGSETAEALERYETALRLRPDYAEVHFSNGQTHIFLNSGGTPAVMLGMVGELLLLFALIGAAWLSIWRMKQSGRLRGGPDYNDSDTRPAVVVSAVILQSLLMLVLCLVLVPYDAKSQALVSVGLAAFLATALSVRSASAGSIGPWMWLGPAIGPAVGYLLAYSLPTGLATANLAHPLAAVGHALPLDYASAGTFGAVVGFWAGCRWDALSPVLRFLGLPSRDTK